MLKHKDKNEIMEVMAEKLSDKNYMSFKKTASYIDLVKAVIDYPDLVHNIIYKVKTKKPRNVALYGQLSKRYNMLETQLKGADEKLKNKASASKVINQISGFHKYMKDALSPHNEWLVEFGKTVAPKYMEIISEFKKLPVPPVVSSCLKQLVKAADELDKGGFSKEASKVDLIINDIVKISEK